MTQSLLPRWFARLVFDAEHLGYQGELELISFVFGFGLMLGAYLLAACVLVWDVL